MLLLAKRVRSHWFDEGTGLSTSILVVETAFDLTGSTKEPDYACGIKNFLDVDTRWCL